MRLYGEAASPHDPFAARKNSKSPSDAPPHLLLRSVWPCVGVGGGGGSVEWGVALQSSRGHGGDLGQCTSSAHPPSTLFLVLCRS